MTPRRLAASDIDGVTTIDEAIVGRSRRTYFEKRLEAALENPALHVQFGVDRGGSLAGYVLARRLAGEFGRVDPALRLEVVGVRPDAQGHGIGAALLAALGGWARDRDIREIRTQASWRDHGMLRFFDRGGFELGRHQVMDAEVGAAQKSLDRRVEESAREEPEPSAEIDYSGAARDDHEALARDRVEVRLLAATDAGEVARIDRHLTGRDRSGYITQAVKEAIEGSAVRVSLIAKQDGIVTGFIMAKTDFGDYGRAEPVAVIDTLGVDPAFAKRGIGTALLSQLLVNLTALGVERVETVVSRENFALLGFLYAIGFGPSKRLGFVKAV